MVDGCTSPYSVADIQIHIFLSDLISTKKPPHLTMISHAVASSCTPFCPAHNAPLILSVLSTTAPTQCYLPLQGGPKSWGTCNIGIA